MATTSDATMTAYGAFLGNRYKSYPNIIWLQGGDANVKLCGSDLAKKVDDIARGILSADPVHLMAVEATNGVWGEASATNWSSYTYGPNNPSGWLTLGTIYPKGTPDKVFSAEIAQIISQNMTETKATPFVPYFSIEDPYEYEPWSPNPTMTATSARGLHRNIERRYPGKTLRQLGRLALRRRLLPARIELAGQHGASSFLRSAAAGPALSQPRALEVGP